MPTKVLFGWTLLPAAALTGIVLACVFKRVRDLFFILLVFLAPLIERVEVNFVISDPQIYGLFELFKLVRGMILFLAVAFYLRSEREMRLLILAFGAAVCYQGLLALKERYLDGVHRVSGTLDDSNSLSVF